MRNNLFKKTITAFASIVILLSTVAFTAFAVTDLSRSGLDANQAITPTDVVENYLGEKISDSESEFLNKYAELHVTYKGVVTTDQVKVDFEDSKVKVEASAYTYAPANGTVLYLLPVKALISGTEYQLTGGKAEITVEGATEVTVIYEGSIKISTEEVSELLSLYYDTASFVYEKDGYPAANDEYLEYLMEKRLYDDALAKYNKYLASYELYLSQKEAYENYEADYAQYVKDLEAYVEYNAKMQALEAQIKKYEAYSEKMSIVKDQLANFEIINKKMTNDRSIYAAVMGGAVDQVLENEDAIVSFFGVKREIVLYAGIATDNVRTYMTEYNALKTESEKYAYYATNYKDIAKNFHLLTKTLEKLYHNTGVREMMRTMEREEKYIILVCQLAHISNLLMDEEVKNYDGNGVFNSSWTMDGRTIETVLGKDNLRIDNNNAAPLADGYPAPVAKPNIPEAVVEPTKPQKPATPAEPAPVENPGDAPAEVSAPKIPVAANDTVKLLDQILSAADRTKLKEAYSAGNCVEREAATTECEIAISTDVKKLKDPAYFEVKFVDHDGTALYSAVLEEGSRVVYFGATPSKSAEADGTYTFAGWYEFKEDGDYSNSQKISLSDPLTRDITLVPAFDFVPTIYTVRWIVDGKIYKSTCASGEIPECPIVPEKNDYYGVGYRFVGWDKPVEAIRGNTNYEAVFEEYYIVPVGTGGASIDDDGTTITVTSVGVYGAQFDISGILNKIAGQKALKIKTSSGTLDFSFTDVIRLKEVDAKYCSLASVYNPKSGKYTFEFVLTDSDGNDVDSLLESVITVPVGVSNLDAYTVSYQSGDTTVNVPYSYAEKKITFTAPPNQIFTFAAEYDILLIVDPNVTVEISAVTALPNTKVYLSYTLKEGYNLTGFSLTDADGNEITIGEDGSFLMPASDLVLAISAVKKVYTVRFIANGIVISSVEYEWGEIPVAPAAPTRAADENYSYTFVGWSSEIVPVTEDATYEAVYSSEPIIKEEVDGLKLSPKIKQLLKYVTAAGIFVVVAIVGLIVVIIILKKRDDE